MLRPQHTEQVEPYVDDSCKLLLHFNGVSGNPQFIDSGNEPKVVTAYGNAILSNAHYRFGGTSGYFDGTGDYLTVPSTPDLSGSKIFTISLWVYRIGTNTMVILSTDDNTGTIGNWLVGWNTSGGAFFQYRDSTTWYGGGTFTANMWHHFAVISDGSNVYVYIDGIQVYTHTITNALTNQSGLGIGGNPIGNVVTNGYIDEVIFWKGIAKPIGELYPQKRPYGYPIGGT